MYPIGSGGERVAAVVVRERHGSVTEAELQDLVKSKLRSSRTPDHIEFRDELPYTDTGKLLRRQLRVELGHLGDGS